MSRTVSDLLEAIRPDEDHLFDTEAVWQRSKRRARQRTVHRRVALAAAAGVAAVVAIATPSLVLTAGSPSPDPIQPGQSGSATPSAEATASPSPPPSDAVPSARAALSATLRAVSSTTWVIAPAETNAYMQLAYVRRAAETAMSGSVEVYEAGAFDPSPMLAGTRTTVDGESAYFAWVPDPYHTAGEVRRALAWQYGPDAWVVVRIEHDTPTPSMSAEIPSELVEIASLVEIGDPEPVRLPFQVGYRPDTMVPVSVSHFEEAWLNRVVYYEYINAPSDFRDRERKLSLPLYIGMQPAVPEQWRPDTAVGGQPAMRNGSYEVIIQVGDQWVTIGSGSYAVPLTIEEIEQIFAGLTFADWTYETTWFDANTAA